MLGVSCLMGELGAGSIGSSCPSVRQVHWRAPPTHARSASFRTRSACCCVLRDRVHARHPPQRNGMACRSTTAQWHAVCSVYIYTYIYTHVYTHAITHVYPHNMPALPPHTMPALNPHAPSPRCSVVFAPAGPSPQSPGSYLHGARSAFPIGPD